MHLKINLTDKNDRGTILRRRDYTYARALYYALCRDLTGLSLQSMAETLEQDHATALNQIENFRNFEAWGEVKYLRIYDLITDNIRKNNRAYFVEELIRENIRLRRENNTLKNKEYVLRYGSNVNRSIVTV